MATDVETRDWSISDPALAEHFGVSSVDAGVAVNETTALGHTAVFRSVALVSGTIASLPLKSYRKDSDGNREQVATFLDDPGGPIGLTPFEWKELVLLHLLLHGNAYLLHIRNGAGAVVGLEPVHPRAVSIELPGLTAGAAGDRFTGKIYTVQMADGHQAQLTDLDLTHVMGMGSDGLRGYSPIWLLRNAISTALAGEQAAGRMFRNGAMLGGIVTSEEDVTQEDMKALKDSFMNRASGSANAGDIAFVNRSLKFSPWTMTAEDADFIESRVHSVEEIGRIFGVPPHLLGQTEKQTSWGTGVAEQNRGLARYTLDPWTSRLEEKLSTLLSRPTFCEFDYKELLKPAPEQEITLLLNQVAGGLLTVDEARMVLNLPPLTTQEVEPVAAGTE